jgi:hypothetical protein
MEHLNMPRHYPRRRAALLAAALALASPTAVRATEGGFVAGPIGGSDIRAALLPPPGTYGVLVPIVGRGLDFRNRDGSIGPVDFTARFGALGFGGAHVFRPEVFGGRFYAAAVGSAATGCGTQRAVPGGLSVPTRSECQTGFGDTTLEAGWGRHLGTLGLPGYPGGEDPRRAFIPYGLSVTAGLGALLPTGAYGTRDLAPPGLNTFVLWPNVALTWTSPPWLGDGTEVSARAFFLSPFRNPKTDYQSGQMAVLDWAVSERFGRWQVGAAGTAAWQTNADRVPVPGAGRVRGPTTSVTAVGPVVAVDVPELSAFVALKYLTEVEATWRLRQDRLTLRIGFAF